MIDYDKIQHAVTSMLQAIGEDPKREGLADTPRRVAEMYGELFSGIAEDPAAVLTTGFEEAHTEAVMLRDVSFYSICEHHLLPFFGSAHIAYIPTGRVVGASKLARALDILTHRPQIQERLTNQLADTIYQTLKPASAAVIISAEHLCMSLRGVRKPGSRIVTTASRGSWGMTATDRQELLSLLRET